MQAEAHKEHLDEKEAGKREAKLKAELQQLKGRRKALKDDMKRLKRELKDLRGSKPSPIDEDDDDGREEN